MFKTFRISAIIFIAAVAHLTGCFRNPHGDAEAEFRTLMNNQFSASGSDLTFAACGWPVSGRMELKALKLDLFPDSTSSAGRGYAEISADGAGFTCSGKIFFTYGYGYSGGHGYSGSTDLKFGPLERESAVDEKISGPAGAALIETGKPVEGELNDSDRRLPDNAAADFYYLELKDKNPGIKITANGKNGLHINGSIYQNNMLISSLPLFGLKLKPGTAVILISAGGKKGEYSIRIDELTAEEKSNLK